MGAGVWREIEEGGDICVIYLWLIHVVVRCKAIILQLKTNKQTTNCCRDTSDK